jgi:hypothetical protein
LFFGELDHGGLLGLSIDRIVLLIFEQHRALLFVSWASNGPLLKMREWCRDHDESRQQAQAYNENAKAILSQESAGRRE